MPPRHTTERDEASTMTEHELTPVAGPQETNTDTNPTPETPTERPTPAESRFARAGKIGAERARQLIERGLLYERQHGLTPGRQRQRQLIQLGKRYEEEHGLAEPVRRKVRRSRDQVWAEFLALLAEVVKPAYQPEIERLLARVAENHAADPEPAPEEDVPEVTEPVVLPFDDRPAA
jgi:hypothetical protein